MVCCGLRHGEARAVNVVYRVHGQIHSNAHQGEAEAPQSGGVPGGFSVQKLAK